MNKGLGAALVLLLVSGVFALQGGFVPENIIYQNVQRAGGRNPRDYGVTEWKYFPISLWVTGAGVSHLDPLIAPDLIPRLFLVRISAFSNTDGVATGNTIINVDAHNGGTPTTLGSLTLPTALAAFTVVTAELEVAILSASNMVIMAIGTDGEHRSIFATAYFAQVPLRR